MQFQSLTVGFIQTLFERLIFAYRFPVDHVAGKRQPAFPEVHHVAKAGKAVSVGKVRYFVGVQHLAVNYDFIPILGGASLADRDFLDARTHGPHQQAGAFMPQTTVQMYSIARLIRMGFIYLTPLSSDKLPTMSQLSCRPFSP